MRGLKYVSEYSDIKGGQYKVEVWVEGYSSTPIFVTMGGDPVVITRNKSVPEIYLGGIVPTFYSFQFLTAPGFNSSSFLSENYGDVIIKHFTGASTTPDFEAIVSPFVTEEADLPTGMSVFTLQGECGLEYLRNKKIPVTLTEARLIDIVREGIDLIPGETDFPYKVIDNTRVYTSAGLVNDGAYFIERLINKQTFKDLTYYEVFEQLFAARVEIVFDSGAWHIRNLSELSQVFSLAGRSTTLVNYSAGGVRGSTQVINSGTTKVRKAGGVFGRLFSQKNIVIERGEVEKINFITNGSFNQSPLVGGYPPGWTANGSFSSATDTVNGWFQMGESIHTPSFVGVDNAYLQSSSVSWRPYFSLSGQWQGAEKMFFVVDQVAGNNIRTGRYQVIATSDTGRVLYLNADGSWVTNATFFEKSGNFEYELPIPEIPIPITVSNYDQSVSFTVLVRLFRPARNTSNSLVGGAEDFQRWFDVKLNKDNIINFEKIDLGERVDYRANVDADRENKLQIKSLIALKNAFPYRHGSLFISAGNEITGFESPFGFGLGGFPYELYLSNSYLSVTSNRLRTYRGNLYDSVRYVDIIQIDSTRYRIQDFTYSIKFQDAGVYLVELLYTSASEILTREINDRADEAVRKVIEQINQSNIIPQDFNFQSQGQFGGRTTFGIRPDTRFQSTNIQQLFLRVDDSDPDVSITPAGGEINLLTPAKVGAGLDEIIATREWANLQFQPIDADLTALAALNTVGVVRRTGAGAFATMAGTQNRVVKWGTNGELVDTIIRETGSSVIIGADTARDSAFEVLTSVSGVARFQNATATSQTILRIANDLNTRLAIQVYGSQYSEGSVFSVGPDGVAVSHQGNGPLAIGTFGVSQPIFLGTNSLIRARILANGRLLIGTDTDAGELLQVQGTARIATSLTTPIIGNPAGVTANNTWTFSSNVNVPLLPTASAHATSKQYVDNLVATGIKEGIPVRTIALSDITLSGTQTVSGVALIAGDRVLVAGQSTPSQNGVYIVASGSWSRATDSDTDAELRGYQYLITAGTYINAKYRNANTDAITVGTTAITYVVSQGAETDPIFSASPAFGITSQNILDWNSVYSTWGTNTPDSIFATRSTTNLAEGTRLYFTDARARAAVTQGVSLNRIVAGNADGTLKDSIAYIDGGRIFTIEAEFPSLLLQGTHAEAILYRIDNFITGVSNSGFSIYDTAALSNTFVINSSRNVGIGVDNPLTRLEVGSAGATIARLRSSSGGALFIASPNSTDTLAAFGDANAIVGGGAGTRAMLWTNGIPLIIQNAQLQVNNSLITPVIGNSAGVSAQNTWTFASNINIPLAPSASTHATSKFYVDNAVQSALDAKQNLNSILTALTGISGNGVVRWNGSAFSASAIGIGDVANLSTALASLEILKDGTILFPLNGVREIRSIDYHQARMDFGFDKTLDIPYLFYDTGSKILVNYMDNNGIWVHVDQNGEEKRYLREGDVATIGTPNLQQVSQAGRNSTLRLQFNGINYALEGAAPNLNSVLASGANSSIRAQFNGVGYATLAEVGGGGGSVGSLAAVLAVGNNTNGIDINLNGFGVIRTGDVSGVPTVTIGNNANVDINSFNTIRIQSTNIRLNSGNLFGVNDFVDIGVTLDSDRFSKLLMGTIDGQDGKYITLRGNFIGIRGVEATGSPSAMFLDAKQIVIGSQTPGGVDVFRIAPNVITIGDVVGGSILQPKFNFRPAAFTNGQKYVFQYNSATNTFNLVNA